MAPPRFRPRSGLRILIGLAVAAGLLFPVSRAAANIVPAGIVFFDVRPYPGQWPLCQSDIVSCSDAQSSTSEVGYIQFQVFIDLTTGGYGGIVSKFVTDLSWPNNWYFDYGECCQGGTCSLDVYGDNPHHLEIDWPCPDPGHPFLALTLLFWVDGYGRLERGQDARVWVGCYPDGWWASLDGVYAEAGAGCEYTNQPCAWYEWDFECEPVPPEYPLVLRGIEGGTAHAEGRVRVFNGYGGCDLHVNTGLEWLTGAWRGSQASTANLILDADLNGVAAGVYETEVQIESGTSIARCMPVRVNVLEARNGLDAPSRTSGIDLRLDSGNPCSGPFAWSFRNQTTESIRCDVFDASGRLIARLLDAERSPGAHTILWDGRDAEGNHVAPGVYMVRLAAGGVVQSKRVVVIR